MKHIKFSKIGQFRDIVSNISHQISYVGLSDNGDIIYDKTISKPTLTFKGTVKLHGTNAGVCYNDYNGIWFQSREHIIIVGEDNLGFAFNMEPKKPSLLKLFKTVSELYNIDTSIYTISIFGEWAGKGINSGKTGISEIDKAFFIFDVKISKEYDDSFISYYLDSSMLRDVDNRIYNIEDYKTYAIDVDFNMPKLVQNKLIDITTEIELECPVSKSFGVLGTGEGCVWHVFYKGVKHRFKVKGKKHSVSKVKTLASVDIEKLNSIKDFVDYAVTENRVDQGIGIIFNNDRLDIKKTGDLIRWIIRDILTEELDTLIENNLDPKEVNKYISDKAREIFFRKLENDIYE
jgi:hypothetical protein